jgi:hypothetical protein
MQVGKRFVLVSNRDGGAHLKWQDDTGTQTRAQANLDMQYPSSNQKRLIDAKMSALALRHHVYLTGNWTGTGQLR